MPTDINLLTDEEKSIVAIFYQERQRERFGDTFRSTWVFQEDFMSHDIVTQFFDPYMYVYVKEENNAIVLSSDVFTSSMSDVDPERMFETHRKYLKWEPKFHPDDRPYYDYHCLFCGEGLPKTTCECLGCGFSIQMTNNEDYDTNKGIIESHYRRMELIHSINNI